MSIDDDNNNPENLALALGGLAVAVNDSLNNNDANNIASYNNHFDALLNMPDLHSTLQNGTVAAEAVKQSMAGDGNQFQNDQVQNLTDNDNGSANYTFDNGAQGGAGGNGGVASGPSSIVISQANSGTATGGAGGAGTISATVTSSSVGGAGGPLTGTITETSSQSANTGNSTQSAAISAADAGGAGGSPNTSLTLSTSSPGGAASTTQANTVNVALPDLDTTGHGGNGGNALGFSMAVTGGNAGPATGGAGDSVGHDGTDVGSALSSTMAQINAFNLTLATGANTQQISLDATQDAVTCPCPEDDGAKGDTGGHGNNVAADLSGTAIAVDGSGNNNDHNAIGSFNDGFNYLTNLPAADVTGLDGTLSAKGLMQTLAGGGNQFANDQIQNLVDNDTVSTNYNFDNCECPLAGGAGGIGFNDGFGGAGGSATGFTMSVVGGNAAEATGGFNNHAGFDGTNIGSASSTSTAQILAFNQNVIMGANFQSESLTHAQTVTIDHVTH